MSHLRSEVPRALFAFGLVLLFSAPRMEAQVTPLGGEFRANNSTASPKNYPNVSVNAGGSFQVVWEDGASNAKVRRFNSSGAPVGEDVVNANNPAARVPQSASLSSAGAFVVVFRSSYGAYSGNGLSGRLFNAGGPVGYEFRIDTHTTNAQQKRASVAAKPNGDFIVVWAGSVSPGFGGSSAHDVVAQRYTSTGATIGPNFAVNSATTSAQGMLDAHVAASSAGNFIVTWSSNFNGSPSGYDVFAQRLNPAGGPLGSAFRVNSYTTGNNGFPSAAFDPSGDFVIAWGVGGFSSGRIWAQRYSSAGSPIGGEFQVDPSGNASLSAPVGLASLGGFSFVVSWDKTGVASSFDIVSRLIGPSGLLGAEFRVNTYTTYSQYKTSVGADSAGNFTVVWASQQNVGIATEQIFGQRYCPSLVSAGISLTSGSTNICPGLTAGTLTVNPVGGGTVGHQWGYRTVSGGSTTSIAGQTGQSYVLNTGNTLPSGTLYVVCTTTASCGGATVVSNEIVVFKGDVTAPGVTPPSNATTQQTLCQ